MVLSKVLRVPGEGVEPSCPTEGAPDFRSSRAISGCLRLSPKLGPEHGFWLLRREVDLPLSQGFFLPPACHPSTPKTARGCAYPSSPAEPVKRPAVTPR